MNGQTTTLGLRTGLAAAPSYPRLFPMTEQFIGSTVERIPTEESGNGVNRDLLETDCKRMDHPIVTEKMLADTTKGTQACAQACPHAFHGVGVDFVDIVAIVLGRPFMDVMRHR
jgi:hypothetical protein